MTPVLCAVAFFIQTQPLAVIGAGLQSRKEVDRLAAIRAAADRGPAAMPLAGKLCAMIIDDSTDVAVEGMLALKRIEPELRERVATIKAKPMTAEFLLRFAAEIVEGKLPRPHARALLPALLMRLPFWREAIAKAKGIAKVDLQSLPLGQRELLGALVIIYNLSHDVSESHAQLAHLVLKAPDCLMAHRFAIASLGGFYRRASTAPERDKHLAALVGAVALRNKEACLAAVEELASIGPAAATALPSLKRLLLKDDSALRDAAEKAIDAISKKGR